MGRGICKLLALLAGFGLLLLGLALFGPWALSQLRPRDRYRLPLVDVDCPSPPGLTKADFLDEVQYYGQLPDELELLDRQLPGLLADAFALHPWVERVERVEVAPPRQVRVRLTFRTPALAVAVNGRWCVVDGEGVLLPGRAEAGLPRYSGPAPARPGPVGKRWGDPEVEAAARQARRK